MSNYNKQYKQWWIDNKEEILQNAFLSGVETQQNAEQVNRQDVEDSIQ